jgi:SatD family (SatD)
MSLTYTHAALMGDLVSSEATPSVPDLYATFNAAIAEANRETAKRLVSPLTITLGDEFQGIFRRLADGLDVMRAVRTRLLSQGVACRFALGVIRLETPVNDQQAWNMMGLGLANTRQRLTDKRDPNAYRFDLPGQPTETVLMEAIGASLSDIESGWTERQRDVVLASLTTPASELARQSGMALQTFYKHRWAGHFDVYVRQWEALREAARSLDAEYGLA